VVLGCKEERNRGGEKKYLNQMKRAQAIEIKDEFEFKQPKAMLQHECNK
jgi:predicted transcriptional regulator